MAIAALGYDCPKYAVSELFDSIDDDKSGFIEFEELKAAIADSGNKKFKTRRKKKKKERKRRRPRRRQTVMAPPPTLKARVMRTLRMA